MSTKLYIPPTRPQLVSRPRLLERLNQGLTHRLTVVAAPAGFGKTTLVAAWIHTIRDLPRPLARVAWLSLDEDDNDPTRFFAYLVAGLQQINPQLGLTVQNLLQSGGSLVPVPENLMTPLLNEITALLGNDRLVLVLDDYHLLETPLIHAAVNFLLENMPPPLHLVIASRTVPPLILSRLRARGQLTELRAADLRFTTAEISEFFNSILGLGLTSADVAALEARTEGWIAGLQLAALSLQEHANRADFIKVFSGDDRYVLDYLLDEVFSRQPEVVQNFLLQTSILDSLCGPLCDAILGTGDQRAGGESELTSPAPWPWPPASGQEILEHLEQANLFIVPLDNKREWYRYHPLLLDLLRHRLARTTLWEKNGIATLHRRAAHWYEQHGPLAEALHHVFAAEDYPWAARLVEQTGAATLWERGEVATLRNWLEKLPRELVYTRPKLCLYWAETMYLTGQLAGIEPLLHAAEQHLPAAQDEAETQYLQGEVMAIRALVAEMEGQPVQSGEAIELTYRALALLPEEELRLRGLLTIGLAEAYYLNGRVIDAATNYAKTIDLGEASHNPFLVIAGLTRLAEVQIIQGQLRRTAETCQRLQQLTQTTLHMSGSLAWSMLLREWNELTAAREQVELALQHSDWASNPRVLMQAHVTLARILQAEGNLTGAFEAIHAAAQVELHHHISQTWDLPPVAAYRAWLWLSQGDVSAVARWAQEQNLHPSDEPAYPHEVEYLILARLLLAQRRAQEAIGLLERLGQNTETNGRLGRAIEAQALLALAYQAHNSQAAALTALIHALTLAEPEGYIRLFVDEGQPMADLLARFNTSLESGRSKGYSFKLLSAFPQSEAAARPARPSQPLPEPLTEREQEILHLIAAGLSNQEIAEKLVLTVGTVKVHARNIYGKLGVSSRTQAVAKARTLNLLP